MVRAIAPPWHRVAAAEQRRDLRHRGERPAALTVVEFEQRAAPHIRWRHGGIGRWRRLSRPDRCYVRLGGSRPHLYRRAHIEMLFHLGRQNTVAAQPRRFSTYRSARALQPAQLPRETHCVGTSCSLKCGHQEPSVKLCHPWLESAARLWGSILVVKSLLRFDDRAHAPPQETQTFPIAGEIAILAARPSIDAEGS